MDMKDNNCVCWYSWLNGLTEEEAIELVRMRYADTKSGLAAIYDIREVFLFGPWIWQTHE